MKRILIADDEDQILSVMRDVLEEAGYQVKGAMDGQKAWNMLEEEKFDLALVDVMMPKVNGYQLITKIQGLQNPPKLVVVTARNFEGDAKVVNQLGVSAFLPKPFSNKDLINVVRHLIG